MGRDLGRRALTHGRAVLLGAALTAGILGGGAAPATADDVTPGAQPTVSIPTVSPPSQQQIDDARNAMDRLRGQGAATTPRTVARVAAPVGDGGSGPATPRISSEGWWTIAAGAMVLLVASESTRVGVRRAKHRGRA